jgi:signal transduction histidine kinase
MTSQVFVNLIGNACRYGRAEAAVDRGATFYFTMEVPAHG